MIPVAQLSIAILFAIFDPMVGVMYLLLENGSYIDANYRGYVVVALVIAVLIRRKFLSERA